MDTYIYLINSYADMDEIQHEKFPPKVVDQFRFTAVSI
jgi:hypothetical protein